MNVEEQAARSRKACRLMTAAQRHIAHDSPADLADTLEHFDADGWSNLAAVARTRPPSGETTGLVLTYLRQSGRTRRPAPADPFEGLTA